MGLSIPELALRRPFPWICDSLDAALVASYDVPKDDYCGGLTLPSPGLASADFDVVVNHDGEDHKDPHGEDTHSGDGFRNQARQDRPSTAEN
jgi:hypothetical protein